MHLAEQGHRVFGTDPSPEFVQLAKRTLAKKEGLDCSFAVSSIEHFDSNETYDCVIASDVLEHIADDRGAIEKMASLLLPGGIIILALPCCPLLFGHYDKHVGHYRRYTKKDIRCLFHGLFKIDAIRHFGFTVFPLLCLYNKVIRKPFPIAKWTSGARKHTTATFLMKWLLTLDKSITPPFGISIIVKGTRK